MGNYKDILRTKNFIAGEWGRPGNEASRRGVASDSAVAASGPQGGLKVKDKYTGELLAELPMASHGEMETAIAGAEAALPALKALGAGGRSAKLEQVADLLEARQAHFVDLIVREAGKPLEYAKSEIARCLVTLRTAAGEAVRFGGEVVPVDYGAGKGRTAFTKRFPVGIVGAITPFNFPLNLALHKIAPALAVGCSIITKPSPFTPLVLLAFAGLVEEAGFPKGSVSVLVTYIPVAERLVTDERIALLSFTGSDTVGWKLKALAGKKRVLLELGGNAATIVDGSADLAFAARRVAVGSFLYAGQICISTQRIFVQEEAIQEFILLLLSEVAQLKVGDPQNAEVLVGPLIDKVHLDRIDQWVKEAVAGGAEILVGGEAVDAKRNVYAPTLLTATQKEMKVCALEAFGPVAVIESVPDFATAIAQVNDSVFGLQAGVFTNRIDQMRIAHDQLEVGGILINDVPGFRVDSMPYGGIKDSGLGREGLKYAMEEMTEPRLLIY